MENKGKSGVYNTSNQTYCQSESNMLGWLTMEIALLPKNSLRIKGKKAVFAVDPMDKSEPAAAIVLTRPLDQLSLGPNTVVVNGPGEYEIGGTKMTGTRIDGEVVYNPKVDGVDIILGKLTSLEKLQHKLKEQNIVVAYVDAAINASFITSLASNVIILYGEHAKELASSFGKDNITTVSKYSATIDKLPQEVETMILE